LIIVQETTVWDGNYANHVYLLSDDKSKMIGYLRDGTLTAKIFKNPIGFDTRGRKFEVLERIKPKAKVTEHVGSKGDIYYVTEEDGHKSCSCPGYIYRGSCKHINPKG